MPGHGYFVFVYRHAVVSYYGTAVQTPEWTHLLPGWNLFRSPDGSSPPAAAEPGAPSLWRVDPVTWISKRVLNVTPLDTEGAYWYWHEDR